MKSKWISNIPIFPISAFLGVVSCEFAINLSNIETLILCVDNRPALSVNDDVEASLEVLDSIVPIEGFGEIKHLDEDYETGNVASAVVDGILSSWSITAEERE